MGTTSCLPLLKIGMYDRIMGQFMSCATHLGKPKLQCPEALQCVGALAKALGQQWRPYAQQLIEPMVSTGLSDTLVEALREVRSYVNYDRKCIGQPKLSHPAPYALEKEHFVDIS